MADRDLVRHLLQLHLLELDELRPARVVVQLAGKKQVVVLIPCLYVDYMSFVCRFLDVLIGCFTLPSERFVWHCWEGHTKSGV